MKKKLYVLSLLVMLSSVGCLGRAISEGYYGTTGASGRAKPLQELKVNLADYDGFVVEPFSDGMEGRGNIAFLAAAPEKIAEQIVKKTYLSPAGTKVLQICGQLIIYDTGTTTDTIAGPMEEAVCRVRLIDKSSGQVLGSADCYSRAKSSVRKGPEELGEGTGKAIADWIIQHDSRGARPEEKTKD